MALKIWSISLQIKIMLDGSPGLVGMGGDSCFKDRGFESQHTGRTFFTFIFCKNCNVCLKKTKINEKVAGEGHFYIKKK